MANIPQNSLAGGIISPSLAKREDLAKQQVGVADCRNMVITSIGSARNRGGLRRIDQVENILYKHRLIPFIPSREAAYVGVWGENTFQVIKEGALALRDIVEAATYKWTLSSSGVGEYYLELLAGGDPGLLQAQYVLENGVKMTVGGLGLLAVGQVAFGDNDTLGYNTHYVRITGSTDPDLESDGYLQTPFLIATPYSSTQNTDHDWAQSADVEYLANKSFTPYKLTRITDKNWTLGAVDIQDGPWLARVEGDEDITWTPSAKTGTGVTITASAPMTNSPGVGDQVRLGYESPFDSSILEWGWATITAVPSTTTLTVDIEKDLGYELLSNPEFKNDTAFWRDESTNVASSVTYDSVNGSAVLNKGAAGDALLRQEVTVPKFERMTLEIVVDVVNTNIQVFIGTTVGASNVLGIQNITTPGTYSYDTLVNEPDTSSVFLTVYTSGAPAASTHKIQRMSLMRRGLGTPHHRNSAWSATKGYPSHITMYDGRLVYAGGSISNTDSMWLTKIGAFESFPFHTPLIDTDAIGVTLKSNEVNAIQFISQFGELVVGTTGQEWRVSPGPSGETVTPSTISAKAKTNIGSAAVRPIVVGNSLLFLNRNANKVYAIDYSFDADGFKPADLTILAPHLFKGYTIVEWALQESPDTIIWCVRSDGALLGLTYIEEQEIWAWHRHDTEGSFESVAVIPEGGVDVVYVTVRRVLLTSIGFTVRETNRLIERLIPNISDEDIYDYNTVDAGVTLDIENDISPEGTVTHVLLFSDGKIKIGGYGFNIAEGEYIYLSNFVGTTEINNKTFLADDVSPYHPGGPTNTIMTLKDKEGDDYIDASQYTDYISGGEIRKGITEISGLEHLNGKTVSILADGAYSTDVVAALDNPATKWGVTLGRASIVVHVGLPYNQDLQSLPLETVQADGTTKGKQKSLTRLNVEFIKSRHAKVGAISDDLAEISFNTADSGNNPPPLKTATIEEPVDDATSNETQFFIRNDKPVPMEISGVLADVKIS
jgi:hypothetical protein